MTRKEQLRMDNILAENALLKEELNTHLRIYSGTLSELVQLKARIETLREVIGWPMGAEHEA